ncbi:alpha 1,2 mannosyltransferase, partial [Ascosphaera atra]
MYRRAYLLLLLVRVYFALSPSYIHPDEHFQGPEVLAGHIFDFPSTPPWEFTSATPIRSIVTPWLLYGLPMTFTKWLTPGLPSADLVYKAIRGHMLMFTFILEDWAVQELVRSRRRRQQALILCASSYVTWTYQSHCFSNSVETVVVLWCLVLIRRVVANK